MMPMHGTPGASDIRASRDAEQRSSPENPAVAIAVVAAKRLVVRDMVPHSVRGMKPKLQPCKQSSATTIWGYRTVAKQWQRSYAGNEEATVPGQMMAVSSSHNIRCPHAELASRRAAVRRPGSRKSSGNRAPDRLRTHSTHRSRTRDTRQERRLRTQTIVGTASALILIVSGYGFSDAAPGTVALDPSRVAAQIVSGIGSSGPA